MAARFIFGHFVPAMQIAQKLEAEEEGNPHEHPATRHDIQQLLTKIEALETMTKEMQKQPGTRG